MIYDATKHLTNLHGLSDDHEATFDEMGGYRTSIPDPRGSADLESQAGYDWKMINAELSSPHLPSSHSAIHHISINIDHFDIQIILPPKRSL